MTSVIRAATTRPAGSGPARTPRPRLRRRLRGAAGVVVVLAVWALLTETGVLDTQNLPTIPAVLSALGDSATDILASLGTTLEAMFIGLVVASVAGGALGLAVGLSAWADAATDVIVRMMRPMPSLALIPVAILLAGLGTTMTSGLVTFAAFWPVFINARYGARQVEPRLLDTGRALHFGRWELIWRVVVPSTAPAITTGVRIAVSMALVVTVSVELVAGTGGLGGYVLAAEQGGSIPQMYAGIIVGGAVGWLLNLAFTAVTRRALRWEAATARGGEA
ncbi:ABC transporter permease [Actinoallomurus acaciae]|uniref:ABC transporter permease n=1 Tax=Actinoallomurus acaciae TaxID=502577 RepID=A0ABV5YC47_9ACTN